MRAARAEIGDALCTLDVDDVRASVEFLGALREPGTTEDVIEAFRDDRYKLERR